LEAALRKQPGVRDCVVIAQQRDGNAEPLAALLLGVPNAETARIAIYDANRALAEYQKIRSWIIWPEPDFPRTPTGKPKIAAITARAAEASSAGRNDEPVALTMADMSGMFAKLGRINQSQDLERDLNLSSLDRVELMSALEQRYQVELNETTFAEAKTVADVQRLLRQPSVRRTEYAYPRWAQREPVRWLRLAVYYALVWPATQILGHPKIIGRENLKNVRGPVLVVSNHITRRADIGLVLVALPARFRHRLATAMSGETLQRMRRPPRDRVFARRWAYQLGYRLVTALFNVFPLPQLSGFRESFRYTGESIDRGYSVLIFPEGEVNNSENGEMAAFQSGIGVLAQNLRIPIVPMRLDGVWPMRQQGRRLAHIGEIVVRIGAPVTFLPGAAANEIARSLESAVRSL
jgi:long-chain acyl-CoA synthetase